MQVTNRIVYADPAMTGAQLRRALKAASLPTKFASKEVKEELTSKVAKTAQEMYYAKIAERNGFIVDDVVISEDGKTLPIIRTKF